MVETSENQAVAQKNDNSFKQWMMLTAFVTAFLVAAGLYVAATPGTTSMDKFLASMAGITGGGFLMLVIVRLFSDDEH